LNYVYFETEPMMNVHERGEHLDFSTALPTEYYDVKPFKNVEFAKKKLLKKIREKTQHAVNL
jgi:hypothetical protein